MKKLKIITIVGTRPELIRLSRVIDKLSKYFNHLLIHTGQNYDYELNQIFFDDLGIKKPNYFLNSSNKKTSVSESIGNIISSVEKVLIKENPDAVLILGDTNSCLSAIPAKRRKIPIFHMEAGNRCFDMRVPEEINRRIVDHIADINLTYSSIAREFLINEGLPSDLVIKTGSPMFEVLNHYIQNINDSKICEKLKLNFSDFFLVSLHREENIDSIKNFEKIIFILNSIAEKFDKKIIFSAHPRTSQKFKKKKIKFNKKIILLKPLGFFDYIKLQTAAIAVLSDSGTICEESSILNFPALNLREAYERHESMEEGSVMLTGLNINRILNGLQILNDQKRNESRNISIVKDYSINNVSDKVVRIIISYVDYINRNVWKKN